jgi:hypothetical protein
VVGNIKFDPVAAEHLSMQGLLKKQALDSLLKNGQDSVMAFPVRAISLKTAFLALGSGKPEPMKEGRYYPIPVWPGPPNPPDGFPPPAWTTWIWIDIQGGGSGNGSVVSHVPAPGPPDPATRRPEVTYPLSGFIHFRITSAEDVAALKRPGLRVGDYAVLVGMHVTTREITRWTWQTFWWLPDANNPKEPSSPAIAGDRPKQLAGAERNYAAVPGYTMVLPQQPNTGGSNSGESVYAYNPYLEAKFDILPASIDGTYQGGLVKNNVGVLSNCMSCHAMASYATREAPNKLRYTGDRYVDLQDPLFRRRLKADFLWSIPFEAK